MRRSVRLWLVAASLLSLTVVLAACGGGGSEGGGGDTGGGTGGGQASGDISIEGSSTVFPITQRVAEAFQQENPDVRITVGGAGSGDGFEALCNGQVPIADASRPIDQEEEVPVCEENGVEFIELPVGLDGIAVTVNPQNNFADAITLEQLNAIWAPDSNVSSWNQVNSEWPDQQLTLYGPGTESGTFDFFTEVVNGEEGASRTDYQASEDDNVLVRGVSGDPNAMGYFGYAYYAENTDSLKALKVDDVSPNPATIESGEYPLSRPLFIYVNRQALEENPQIQEFVNFYLQDGNFSQFVEASDYVALPEGARQEVRTQFEERTTGTIYNENGELPGGELQSALQQSQ